MKSYWTHKNHPDAKYDADITTLKGKRKFRIELIDWRDEGQELPPQRKYFTSWQAAKKAGWEKVTK